MELGFTSSLIDRKNGYLLAASTSVRCVRPLPPAENLSILPTSLTFEWNETSSKNVTVTADGPWTVPNPNDGDFAIDVPNYPGTSANWNGVFNVKPRSENTGTTARTVTFTVYSVGSTNPDAAPKTITVTQKPKPVISAGVLAAAREFIGTTWSNIPVYSGSTD